MKLTDFFKNFYLFFSHVFINTAIGKVPDTIEWINCFNMSGASHTFFLTCSPDFNFNNNKELYTQTKLINNSNND